MINKELTKIILEIKNNKLQFNHILGAHRLKEDLNFTSIQIIKLISEIEAKFNVFFDIEDYIAENFESIDRIIAIINKKVNADLKDNAIEE